MKETVKERLAADGNFMDFCKMVDILKELGEEIEIPLETALMLCSARVDYIKGKNFDILHKSVMEYLGYMPGTVSFYDYFFSKVVFIVK